jgi:hypothetical protein
VRHRARAIGIARNWPFSDAGVLAAARGRSRPLLLGLCGRRLAGRSRLAGDGRTGSWCRSAAIRGAPAAIGRRRCLSSGDLACERFLEPADYRRLDGR